MEDDVQLSLISGAALVPHSDDRKHPDLGNQIDDLVNRPHPQIGFQTENRSVQYQRVSTFLHRLHDADETALAALLRASLHSTFTDLTRLATTGVAQTYASGNRIKGQKPPNQEPS